ncbi:MAG TPA: hypothetical protein VFJ82_26675 [Longimicrobium sp.]|nr:hypothetical protein [Longimicrobium sp.]
MLHTVEAVLEADGSVRFLEEVEITGPRRVLVTILDEPGDEAPDTPLLLSEAALDDWNRPEEEEAWRYLQPETSS